jgi:2,3-bisphosphoglycerate-dependent phosphoglycerate mutase
LQPFDIDTIFSSPYPRSVLTVKPLAQILHLPIHTDPRLKERKLGYSPVNNFYETIRYLWQNPTQTLPLGESNVMACARGMNFIGELLNDIIVKAFPYEPHIVIATHGNLMALILQHYYPAVDYDFWSNLSFPDIYMIHLVVKQDGQMETRNVDEGPDPLRLWIPK